MQRIRFNDTGVPAGAYTVPYNPSYVDLMDSTEQIVLETLDGNSIIQQVYFDARPYTLKWENIPNDFPMFPTLLSVLLSYEGDTKYFNAGDIDYRATAAWEKVKILSVDVNVNTGGKIKYNLTVTLAPEPL